MVRRLVAAAVAVGCVLLFVREPGADQHRLWRLVWDCGHILLFAGIGYLCAGRWLARAAWPRAGGLLLAAAVGGWLIECVQAAIGRDYALADVAADALGMLLGLLVGGRARLRTARRWFAAASVVAALGLGASAYPVARAAIDAAAAAQAFPELANFATGFAPALQRERFSGDGELRAIAGALRMELRPAPYAGFFLDDFAGDWRGWRGLRIELDNPGPAAELTCRINDAAHDRRGYAFADRFNRSFPLAPGVNRLHIDLDAVRRAPRERPMDMDDIRNLGCFFVDLDRPRVLLLRAIVLE